jgi:hypothetical protein
MMNGYGVDLRWAWEAGRFRGELAYRRTSCTPAGRDFSEIAISGWGWLMPDQHIGVRTAGYHHYRIKHLPVVWSPKTLI